MSDFRALTDAEFQALKDYNGKVGLIRDRVRQVCNGTKLCVLIWGEGGTGKSYNVLKTFEELGLIKGKDYILTNSRMSVVGLEDLIFKYPKAIHYFEDVETLFDKKAAYGALRSLTWGQKNNDGEMHRYFTSVVHGNDRRIEFTGKVIITANLPLDDLPELRAIKTRINPLRFQATNPEIIAQMKVMCNQGYTYKGITLTPKQCFEVYDYYLDHVPENRQHDLRILEHGWWDLIDSINKVLKESTWQEIFQSEILKGEQPPVSRASTILKEREIALDLNARWKASKITTAEMQAEWRQKTGKELDSYYRRLHGK